MKHGNTFYLELSREIFTSNYSHLSQNAKWLFVVLNELEQRFTGDDTDFFFRSNEDLAVDAGMSLATLKRTKKELLETDLVHNWNMHWIDTKTKKKSEKKVSAYKILK
jgi:hypothetical protein